MNTDKNKYVVYIHYEPDTLKPFYVGEGTIERAFFGSKRNSEWQKNVINHGGYLVDIIFKSDSKEEVVELEIATGISLIDEGYKLTNVWLGHRFEKGGVLVDKTRMPFYGKKNPQFSENLKKWNLNHRGKNSPNWGRNREDLSKRNKEGKFNRFKRPIKCVEENIEFERVKDAKEWAKDKGLKGWNTIGSSANNGTTSAGYHWKYLSGR